MSYANGTTHYNLPQTVGTDKRDWADPNQAFADIDAAIYGAVQDVATAGIDIDALETRMDTAEGNISTNAGDIAALDTRLTTAEGTITQHTNDIADVRSDCEDMICAYNEATATSTHAYAIGDYFIYNDVLYRATATIGIGDTIVPDTNCTTTNVSSELLKIREDLGQKRISFNVPAGNSNKDLLDILFNRLSAVPFDTALLILHRDTTGDDYEYRICSKTSNSYRFCNTSFVNLTNITLLSFIAENGTSKTYRYDFNTATYQETSSSLLTENHTVTVIYE